MHSKSLYFLCIYSLRLNHAIKSTYLRFFGSPSTIIPTSAAISAAVNDEAALQGTAGVDRLFHAVNAVRGFLLINLGRVE